MEQQAMDELVELGLDTFGDVAEDQAGELESQAQTIRNVIEQGVLADELGIDFFGVGEHHRADFAISSPETVLAAIAGKTDRIALGSAVTVLSSDDPVRVFQRFATLDAASNGRAEVILGRGSFTESFPLFGFDLGQYDELFEEKLDLFSRLLTEGEVTWSGNTRAPLTSQRVYPTTESGSLKTWVGVGGSPQSVVRAASYRLPLMLAIIGGDPQRFGPVRRAVPAGIEGVRLARASGWSALAWLRG
jgi:alkanesulfonate monooxygenase SsuD/methylene tetrahydromethanopterin reductase-like flavin-dependent oxidoreductase (luciferase family)